MTPAYFAKRPSTHFSQYMSNVAPSLHDRDPRREFSMSASTIKMTTASVPGQQAEYDHVFPLVYQCGSPGVTLSDATDWVRQLRDELLKKASQHGAILFRG